MTDFQEIYNLAVKRDITPSGYRVDIGPCRRDTVNNWSTEYRDRAVSEVEMCRIFIQHSRKRSRLNTQTTTYGWKHLVEDAFEQYVSNGCFIVAAYLEELLVRRIGPQSPNALVNLSAVGELFVPKIGSVRIGSLKHLTPKPR